MDIGNLPIYSSDKTKPDATRSRTFDGQPEKKSAWDRIGDYEETPSNDNTVVDEDDEDNYEQPKIVSKLDSDKASQAALKESQKDQL
jgi:hypothetical protein